ncbi:Phage protein [Escherichia phage T4_ev151]|nr:Phage protein [Escherichia phage T4_ev151]
MYKVYADYQANPSKKPNCQIGRAHDTLLEAVDAAQKLGYNYVEIVQLPSGTVITLEEFNNITPNFLLFAGDNYYPCGGYADLIAKAATEDELRDIIKENENKPMYGSNRFDWWQIVNAHTHTIVDEG